MALRDAHTFALSCATASIALFFVDTVSPFLKFAKIVDEQVASISGYAKIPDPKVDQRDLLGRSCAGVFD